MRAMAVHVARDARPAAPRRRDFDYGNNIRAQAQTGRRRRRVRHPRLRAGVHPAAVLRRARAVPLGGALRRSGGHRTRPTRSCSSCSRTTRRWRAGSGWRASTSTSRDCRRASAGWATASAREFGLRFNELVRTRRAEGADRHRPRSPRHRLRRVAVPRDGRHAGRQRRDRRLADPQRAAQHRGRRELGVGPSRRRRRHRLLAARRHGRRRRRQRRGRRSVSQRVLTSDPGMGVVRHADAGYPEAIATARDARHPHADGRRASDDASPVRPRTARARRARRAARAHSRAPRRLRHRPHVRCCAAPRSARRDAVPVHRRRAGRRRRRSGSHACARLAVPRRPTSAPAARRRARPSTRSLAFLQGARGRTGAPATFLLDEVLELRTFESFPGLRHVLRDLLAALAASGNRFVLTTATSRARIACCATRRRGSRSFTLPPLTAAESRAMLRRWAKTAGRRSRSPAPPARARPTAAPGSARASATTARCASRGAAIRQRVAVAAVARWRARARCRFCYELRLHRARGYGALKAILEILAEEEPLTLTEIAQRLQRTPGSTKDYLSWLEDVDLITCDRSATASPIRCCGCGCACTAGPNRRARISSRRKCSSTRSRACLWPLEPALVGARLDGDRKWGRRRAMSAYCCTSFATDPPTAVRPAVQPNPQPQQRIGECVALLPRRRPDRRPRATTGSPCRSRVRRRRIAISVASAAPARRGCRGWP